MGNCLMRCFGAVTTEQRPNKYFIGRYNNSNVDIEFENLIEDDEVQQTHEILTEEERNHLQNNRYADLVAEQQKIDAKIDEQLQEQEESARLEEEAYNAARQEAARAAKQARELERQKLEGTKGRSNGSAKSWLGSDANDWEIATEDDFETFLETVKAKSESVRASVASMLHGNSTNNSTNQVTGQTNTANPVLAGQPTSLLPSSTCTNPIAPLGTTQTPMGHSPTPKVALSSSDVDDFNPRAMDQMPPSSPKSTEMLGGKQGGEVSSQIRQQIRATPLSVGTVTLHKTPQIAGAQTPPQTVIPIKPSGSSSTLNTQMLPLATSRVTTHSTPSTPDSMLVPPSTHPVGPHDTPSTHPSAPQDTPSTQPGAPQNNLSNLKGQCKTPARPSAPTPGGQSMPHSSGTIYTPSGNNSSPQNQTKTSPLQSPAPSPSHIKSSLPCGEKGVPLSQMGNEQLVCSSPGASDSVLPDEAPAVQGKSDEVTTRISKYVRTNGNTLPEQPAQQDDDSDVEWEADFVSSESTPEPIQVPSSLSTSSSSLHSPHSKHRPSSSNAAVMSSHNQPIRTGLPSESRTLSPKLANGRLSTKLKDKVATVVSSATTGSVPTLTSESKADKDLHSVVIPKKTLDIDIDKFLEELDFDS